MAPDKPHKDPERPPKDPEGTPEGKDKDTAPLAPGVWVTETTGFASVPPRAQSDLRDACEEEQKNGSAARGKSDEAAEPRIERYRER